MNNEVKVPRGNTKLIIASIRDNTGKAITLAGAAIVYKVAKLVSSNTFLLEKSLGNGDITITNTTGGVFNITLTEEDTVALGNGTFYHEVKISFADGTKATVLSGPLTITPTLIG